MKALYAPDTILTEVLPNLSPCAKVIFYTLLYWTGPEYQDAWPGNKAISKRSGYSPAMVKRGRKELQSAGIINRESRFVDNWKHVQTSSLTKFNFMLYEAQDTPEQQQFRINLISKTKYATKEDLKDSERKTNQRIDKLTFNVEGLSGRLRQWMDCLQYENTFQGVHYFKATQPVTKSFVEEAFRKEGLKIKIA